MSTHRRGALIVIEGLDRAGKSTQHARVCQNLRNQGHRVKSMRFPDRTTPIGESIGAYLRGESQQEDHVIHLLFSANRWEAAASIRTAIEDGTTVVIDRYYYSGIVYSAAKGRDDLSLRWAREPEVGLPRPDLCLFLDVSPEVAARRGGFGNEKYETSVMQKRVRELFYELVQLRDGEDIEIVDAGRGIEVVERDIMEKVVRLMAHTKLTRHLRIMLPWNEMTQAPE
ncbi:hypothetical protein N7G274_006688 [Stereocaulon virgatum]|uniref:dTMP kinase n=1 Tax=Stereocaulon virgatum TaxID=373712 RepID=A0ABR4A472_9LECA